MELSLEAGKLAVLVLNALHGLLLFYQRDHTELNLDSLFGLRVIEGQLAALQAQLRELPDVPAALLREVAGVSATAAATARNATPYTHKDNPDYFKSFRFLVETPYDVWGSPELTSAKLLWPLGGGLPDDQRDGLSEKDSDECIGQLLGSAAERREGESGCHLVKKPCLSRMLDTRGYARYSLTHQILYTSIAERVNCSGDLDFFIRRIRSFRNTGLDGWRREWCSNLHQEMTDLWREKMKTGSWSVEATPIPKDLFLEQVFTCGQFGFSEFARRGWLEEVLSWQAPNGCFGVQEIAVSNHKDKMLQDEMEEWEGKEDEAEAGVAEASAIREEMKRARAAFDDHSPRKQGPKQGQDQLPERKGQREMLSTMPKRRLLVEKITGDGCGGHTNAVAAGALTIFLRFVLLPGPLEFGHRPLVLEPSERRVRSPSFTSLSADDWGLRPLDRAKVEETAMLVEPRPPSSPARDVTFYFLLILLALFLYATWRLFLRRRKALALYPFAYKKL